jgi:hypothetical protein
MTGRCFRPRERTTDPCPSDGPCPSCFQHGRERRRLDPSADHSGCFFLPGSRFREGQGAKSSVAPKGGAVGLLCAGRPIVCGMARKLPDQRTMFLSRLDRLESNLNRQSRFD